MYVLKLENQFLPFAIVNNENKDEKQVKEAIKLSTKEEMVANEVEILEDIVFPDWGETTYFDVLIKTDDFRPVQLIVQLTNVVTY